MVGRWRVRCLEGRGLDGGEVEGLIVDRWRVRG